MTEIIHSSWPSVDDAEKPSLPSLLLARAQAVPTPVWAGSLFIALGLGFAVVGFDYKLGTLRSMGPGMFPVAQGVLLAALGLAIALSGWRSAERIGLVARRPVLAIFGSVLLFSQLVDTAGLVIAGPVLIGGVVLATGQGSWKSAVILSLGLTTIAVAVFPYLLGVPIKVLP